MFPFVKCICSNWIWEDPCVALKTHVLHHYFSIVHLVDPKPSWFGSNRNCSCAITKNVYVAHLYGNKRWVLSAPKVISFLAFPRLNITWATDIQTRTCCKSNEMHWLYYLCLLIIKAAVEAAFHIWMLQLQQLLVYILRINPFFYRCFWAALMAK
jgi:hypothetical protein